MKLSWHPLVPSLSSKRFVRHLSAFALGTLVSGFGLGAKAGPELVAIDDLQKQAVSVAPHISNLSLVQGVGRRRKANPRPYQPMQQYIAPVHNELGQHEAFLRLLLTAVGFAGILIAILTLRSLPPRRTGS